MTYLVQTNQLTKVYEGKEVISSVNMHVKKGEIYGFLGPNGAGKTTIMKMITNLIKPTSGDIEIFGEKLTDKSYEVLKRMGTIIEYPIFYEKLTAKETLELHCEYMGYYDKKEIGHVLDLVKLTNTDRKPVKDFSLGMKQRLGIARAIITKPELLILDEPINGLDPIGIKEIRELFKMIIALSLDNDTTELKSAILYSLGQKQRIMLDLVHPNGSVNTNRIAIIDADCLAVGNNDSSLLPGRKLDAVAALDQLVTDEDGENMVTTSSLAAPLRSRMMTFELNVAHVIGIDESKKLVFLSRSFWVCSVDLSESGLEMAQRKESPTIDVFEHFFVPYDWFAGKRDIVCALAKRDVVLTRGGDLAVIRGGLDYAERVYNYRIRH